MSVNTVSTDKPKAAERNSESERAALEQTWREPSGITGWLSNVDHKTIGKRFIITAFAFFILGGILAIIMRVQLARPENNILGPDLYNQVFTMHDSTMMFLFAVPVMDAMAVYLIPLMVGTRGIALSRLNAFGYWIYLFGGLFLYAFFLFNVGPDNGWFSYVPLAGPQYGPGKRSDVWAQLITFTEVAALVVAIVLLITIFKLRAPGMSLNRMPLYVWSIVVTSFMVLFAMPTVALASTCLILDRLVGTHFYNPAEGGDALLWQHLFWFFGHPEVYIIFIPATGFISSIIPVFSRRPVFGHTALLLSLVSTGFIGFGLWVHHMFAADLPQLGQSFFTAAGMMIAIPNGVQIFCWLATLWSGRPVFKTPLLFALGFVFVFVLSNKLKTTFPVGARPRAAAFTPDGLRAFVTAENVRSISVIDIRSHKVMHIINLSDSKVKPMGVVVSGDGQRVYVSNGRGNSVLVIDARSYKILTTILVEGRPWGIAITPDNKKVYTANGLSDDIAVIDIKTDRVIKTIKAGQGPWGITISR